jgi:A118 family predicted phage portal protein
MGIFQRIKEWIMSKLPVQSIETALGIKLPGTADMPALIEAWRDAYMGRPGWLDKASDVSLNLVATICSDLSRKACAELEISCALKGGTTKDPVASEFVNQQIRPFLRHQVEYSLAMGAVVARPWKDNTTNAIRVGWYTADQVVPLSWDGRVMTGAVLVDHLITTKSGTQTVLTKLEAHQLKADHTYTVVTKTYKSFSEETLGEEIPIASVPEWAHIDQVVPFQHLTAPLFVYIGTPWANNSLLNSPIGCSIIKDAMGTMAELDATYNSLRWEREGGELAVFVADSMLDVDPRTKEYKNIGPREKRLYLKFQGEEDLIKEYAPTLRIDDLLTNLKAQLSLVCMQCHLDPGAYIYDQASGAITATEVRTKSQTTYGTIVDVQIHMIQPAVKHLMYAVSALQELYKLPVFDKAMEIAFDWGDSILVDEQSDRNNAQAEVTQGLRSKVSYLMEYRGMTEADALKEIQTIKTESPAPAAMSFF